MNKKKEPKHTLEEKYTIALQMLRDSLYLNDVCQRYIWLNLHRIYMPETDSDVSDDLIELNKKVRKNLTKIDEKEVIDDLKSYQ